MRRLKLWTFQDTQASVLEKKESGLDTSIQKWDNLIDSLARIKESMKDICGLCLENRASVSHTCKGCPLAKKDKKCLDSKSVYLDALASLDVAILGATRMQVTLKGIKGDIFMANQRRKEKSGEHLI